ncbi:hypothetical protein AAC387_Pa12g1707 [Persea americana]
MSVPEEPKANPDMGFWLALVFGTVHGIRAKQLRSKKRKKTNWKDAVKEGYELTSDRLEKRKTEDESLKNAGNRKKNAKEALKNQEFKTVRMKEEEEVRF